MLAIDRASLAIPQAADSSTNLIFYSPQISCIDLSNVKVAPYVATTTSTVTVRAFYYCYHTY